MCVVNAKIDVFFVLFQCVHYRCGFNAGNTYGAPTNLYGNVPTGNYTRPGGATRQKSGTVLQVGDLDNKLIGAIKANPYGAPAGSAAAPAAAAGAFVCDHPGCKGSYHTREDLEVKFISINMDLFSSFL